MADSGFHCFAPDWIGFGFSDKPQPGYGFDYTEKEFHEEFEKLLEVLGVTSPFFLVVQGFLVGSYGLTWTLKNPSKISKLAILNTPLTVSSPIPGLFQQLRIPFFGEFTSHNAVMAERFIEAGSAYVLKLEKADVYRLPYLASSGPGFAKLCCNTHIVAPEGSVYRILEHAFGGHAVHLIFWISQGVVPFHLNLII
uniref:Uncharacterized protein isoform X2 n=1 Tax=Nicotiana tabacum TaxID=4097 RepID=A0A1S3ZVJ5_TOBAC|nr:PREDICTED: uncharacterized protein LOC107790926 isoform X2 [Nicotiana tabacum]